jgi:uncharacterized membrane protein YtjA (UPF0391 family)
VVGSVERQQPRGKRDEHSRRRPKQIVSTDVNPFKGKEKTMLYYALVFLIVALIAGFLGFGGVAIAAAGIAKILFFIFLVMFLVTLVTHFSRTRMGGV